MLTWYSMVLKGMGRNHARGNGKLEQSRARVALGTSGRARALGYVGSFLGPHGVNLLQLGYGALRKHEERGNSRANDAVLHHGLDTN